MNRARTSHVAPFSWDTGDRAPESWRANFATKRCTESRMLSCQHLRAMKPSCPPAPILWSLLAACLSSPTIAQTRESDRDELVSALVSADRGDVDGALRVLSVLDQRNVNLAKLIAEIPARYLVGLSPLSGVAEAPSIRSALASLSRFDARESSVDVTDALRSALALEEVTTRDEAISAILDDAGSDAIAELIWIRTNSEDVAERVLAHRYLDWVRNRDALGPTAAALSGVSRLRLVRLAPLIRMQGSRHLRPWAAQILECASKHPAQREDVIRTLGAFVSNYPEVRTRSSVMLHLEECSSYLSMSPEEAALSQGGRVWYWDGKARSAECMPILLPIELAIQHASHAVRKSDRGRRSSAALARALGTKLVVMNALSLSVCGAARTELEWGRLSASASMRSLDGSSVDLALKNSLRIDGIAVQIQLIRDLPLCPNPPRLNDQSGLVGAVASRHRQVRVAAIRSMGRMAEQNRSQSLAALDVLDQLARSGKLSVKALAKEELRRLHD